MYSETVFNGVEVLLPVGDSQPYDLVFDYLYVCTPSCQQYLIKWSETNNRNEITIDDPKYQKYLV